MEKPNPSDKIRIKTKEEEITGILMPAPEEVTDSIIVKLDSGYNIGIDKGKIRGMEVIEKYSASDEHKKARAHLKAGLPTIAILHTGGTIASKVDYKTGAVTAKFTPEELLEMFPELSSIANIRSRLVRNMWSQDMRFSHYNILAREIEKEVKEGADGIIITHGTDTVHYTSAALSFMLENLPVPVLIVGAQRSSDRGSSDAALNLICAAKFIAETDFAEVAVCMHETMDDENCHILPGLKCRKMHTSRRDAFRPINTTAIAKVSKYEIKFLRKVYHKKDKKKKIKLLLMNENIRVGLLKQRTNMFAEEFLFYDDYDGLVIEATGLGNPPTSQIDEFTGEHRKIFDAIKALIENGVIVVVAPETIYGRINLNVYSNQRELKQIGVLGDLCDMTPETAYIKLAWLLSNFSKEEAKILYEQNLKGEISERSEIKDFLN